MTREVISRGPELARVDAWLTSSLDGVRVLVLEGEPGMGKTTLWQAGVDEAIGNGWRTLSARPLEAEATFAYAGLGDLLGTVDDESLAGLPLPQQRALRVALGVVGGSAVIAETPGGSPLPSGRRLESPDHGIAVTIPRGWLNTPEAPSLPVFESVIATAPIDGPGECVVEPFAFEGVESSKMAETLGHIGGYDEFEISEGAALPAGDMVREEPVVRLLAHEARGGQAGTSVAYVLAAPAGYAWLWCSTTEAPPEDLWLSFANTLAFLPVAE